MTGPMTAPTRANGVPHIAHSTTPITTGAMVATNGNGGAELTATVDHCRRESETDAPAAQDNANGRGSVKNRGR